MEWSCLRLFSAFRISVVMLGLGGTAFWSTLFTVLRTVSACSASIEWSDGCFCLRDYFCGSDVGRRDSEISPFLSRVVSASLSVLEDRLMTQFVWSTLGVEVDLLAAFCSRRSFSNFCFCCSLVLLKTSWVLVLICSRIVFSLELTKIYQEGLYFLLLRNLWILEL